MTENDTNKKIKRPPVVAIMGHIDHGKTTLLDYLRKSKVTENEAGGITQHIAAYEVIHKDEKGDDQSITFIDTPGHEAFGEMRSRGASIADIVILIISGEDGPKPQTLEAYEAIKKSGTPFLIAISKIDKSSADPEKVKRDLMEHEIFVEGMGGDISAIPISAQTGEGIDELLSVLLLLGDIEEFSGDPDKLGEGVIIETNLDPKKGISGTLIIKNGSIKQGQYVVAGGAIAPVRIMEDFQGNKIDSATLSRPVRIVGWNKAPEIGSVFYTFNNKKEAEDHIAEHEEISQNINLYKIDSSKPILPIILKTDVLGSIEAVKHEINKIPQERINITIVSSGIGTITEGDVKQASGKAGTIIVGFHVNIDSRAKHLSERMNVEIKTFDIIYELAEYLKDKSAEYTPKQQVEEVAGSLKVIRLFSQTKDKQVIGGKVEDGSLSLNDSVNIVRRENVIGKGIIKELQQQKVAVKEVNEGECGMMIESKTEIAENDRIQSIKIKTI